MIQLIRIQRDILSDQIGVPKEQTPIEKVIDNFKKGHSLMGANFVIDRLKELLPYEKQHIRDVAEKAARYIVENYVQKEWNNNDESLLQTYLNQNHPL